MMRFVLLGAMAAMALAAAGRADAKSIDGWLGQCSATAAAACTEPTSASYARQPISFASPIKGVTISSTPYQFSQAGLGTVAGRAIFDAPTGGHLLVVLPLATSYAVPSQGDYGDVGALRFTWSAMTGIANGDAFSSSFLAGATVGATPDGSAVTVGTNETFTRGVLAAYPGSVDPIPVQVTEATGFSYQIPTGDSTVDVLGAGTLAAGTLILPQAPANGFLQRIECGVTVTALTVTPGTGTAITGNAPTTCGANASHELQYQAGNSTWSILF